MITSEDIKREKYIKDYEDKVQWLAKLLTLPILIALSFLNAVFQTVITYHMVVYQGQNVFLLLFLLLFYNMTIFIVMLYVLGLYGVHKQYKKYKKQEMEKKKIE